MKIILVNKFHYLKGGSETYYFGLAEGLKALGHEVHFFAMEGPDNVPCEDEDLFVSSKDYNGPTSFAQKINAAASLIYSKEAKHKFQALCERVQPDIVHMNLVHRQITLSILDAPYLKTHHVPVLFTSHDYILVCPSYVMLDGASNVCDACLDGKFTNCFKRKCVKGSTAKSAMGALEAEYLKLRKSYRKIDRIIAPSEFMRGKLIEGGFPTQQVVCMQNFAKQEILDNASKATDKTSRENPYLLFFGRLSKEKGIDVLVDAFIAAIPSLPSNVRLVIAGDGPERESIEEKIASADSCIRSRIELAGYQAGSALQAYVEGASLAIASSRWRENMPYSIVEAFAAGTPVVGARIGGIPELVANGVTGFACEPGDVATMADAMVRGAEAFLDAPVYVRMQESCRAYVRENCSRDKFMDQLVELYEEAVNG